MDLHNFGAGVPAIPTVGGVAGTAKGGNGIAQYTSAHQQLQAPFSAAVNGGKADAANLLVYDFAGVGDASLNYRINSALTPQYSCQPHQWQYISAEANQVEKTRAPNTCLTTSTFPTQTTSLVSVASQHLGQETRLLNSQRLVPSLPPVMISPPLRNPPQFFKSLLGDNLLH